MRESIRSGFMGYFIAGRRYPADVVRLFRIGKEFYGIGKLRDLGRFGLILNESFIWCVIITERMISLEWLYAIYKLSDAIAML